MANEYNPLAGYGRAPAFVMGVNPPGVQNPNTVGAMDTGFVAVADGTPIRVVMLAISAAAGLTALKWAGFRFNVGVST